MKRTASSPSHTTPKTASHAETYQCLASASRVDPKVRYTLRSLHPSQPLRPILHTARYTRHRRQDTRGFSESAAQSMACASAAHFEDYRGSKNCLRFRSPHGERGILARGRHWLLWFGCSLHRRCCGFWDYLLGRVWVISEWPISGEMMQSTYLSSHPTPRHLSEKIRFPSMLPK